MCWISYIKSPSEKWFPSAQFLWADSLPVLYQLFVTGPPWSKWSNLWRRPNTWRPPEISLFSAKPQQSLSLLIGVLSKNRKKTNGHCCCPISTVILTTSKLEAILEICRCSLKLVKSIVCLGWGGGGGKVLSTAPFHVFGELVQQVASGYACLVTPFHCSISVSFSFSTFLCFAASWTGVDKKYSHYLRRTIMIVPAFLKVLKKIWHGYR